jgi:hypothetical protein
MAVNWKALKNFEVKYEKYDYFFAKATVICYDCILAENKEDAVKRAIFKHGDGISILAVDEEIEE